jgi:hypothetical protein
VAHGPARRQYEESWPVETSVAFANAVLAAPMGLRPILSELCRDDLKAEPIPISPAAATDAVKRRVAQFTGQRG